jgi:flagellar basal body P-ring formation protein FlgA
MVVVTIPKDRAHYTLPTTHIIDAFRDKNVTIIDSSEGVVTFKRNCDLHGKLQSIEQVFMEKLQALSPWIVLEKKPNIMVKSTLPNDFERYHFESLSLGDNALKKNSGSFIALFTANGKPKKITFYYEMEAKLPVFKAKRNLQSGKILQNDDSEVQLVELNALPSRAIVGELPPSLISKNYIKEGQILSDYLFDVKKDVMKKETLKGFLSEGSMVIELHVTLLEDANIGDVVKVKTEQGKVLSAKIISKNEAKILE